MFWEVEVVITWGRRGGEVGNVLDNSTLFVQCLLIEVVML